MTTENIIIQAQNVLSLAANAKAKAENLGPSKPAKDGKDLLDQALPMSEKTLGTIVAQYFATTTMRESYKFAVQGYLNTQQAAAYGAVAPGEVTNPFDHVTSPTGYFQSAIGKKATKENLLRWYQMLSEGDFLSVKNEMFTEEEQDIYAQRLEQEKEFDELKALLGSLGFENVQVMNKEKRQVVGTLREQSKVKEAYKTISKAFGITPDIKLKLADQKLGDVPSVGWKTNIIETTQESEIPGMPATKIQGFGSASVYITVPVGFKLKV